MSSPNPDMPNHRPAPLPPGPATEPFTRAQLGILTAIADAVVPSLTPSAGNRLLQHPLRTEVYNSALQRVQDLVDDNAPSDLADAYLRESATSNPEFKDLLCRFVAFYVNDAARGALATILTALNTRAGSLLLTGHATPLDCLPIKDREQILAAWSTSRIPILRGLARSVTQLVRIFWLRTSPTLGKVLSYPALPVNAVPTGQAFPFSFVQIPPPTATNEPEVIETDVVIVGSGCGGGVVAKTLSEAGLKVLVVEKSYYWAPEYLPMSESEAFVHLFAGGGGVSSEDGSITAVAGSAWGGGGTINWSASLQPQGMLRREWAQKFGLTHFMGSDFQDDLDFVCERMGVGASTIAHNKANIALMEGARKMGWTAKPVPQNTGGEVHNDGYCTRGCRDCGKKGPAVSWLPDAARAGASFMEGFEATSLVFGETVHGEREVTGIQGIWKSRDSNGGVAGLNDRTTREVIIKATRTIISGGSLFTPILLQRSGLKNKHIGRHLHLHPVSFVAAVWDEDVRPWEGPILTSVCSEFENMDGQGYGVKLEATTMIPGVFLPLFGWQNGLQWKEFTAKMKRMTGYISLARDRYGGRVFPDPKDGRCNIEYHPHAHDRKHILEGVIRLSEIMYVEGAREIHAAIPNFPPFIRPSTAPSSNIQVTPNLSPSVTDALFQTWLASLRSHGLPSPDCGFASAHQMGTCRMGTTPKNSAVDHRGRVWGTKGLYVADASVFPSASGVNPMITTMGVARGIARGIVDEERVAKPERARL